MVLGYCFVGDFKKKKKTHNYLFWKRSIYIGSRSITRPLLSSEKFLQTMLKEQRSAEQECYIKERISNLLETKKKGRKGT
jgi:hypothetical protein